MLLCDTEFYRQRSKLSNAVGLWDSVDSITKLQTKQLKNRSSIPGRGMDIFPFLQRPEKILLSTQRLFEG